MSIYASFREEFIQKGMHCIELCGYGDEEEDDVRYLCGFDPDHITKWLDYLSKAKKFSEWYSRVQDLLT